MSRKVTINTAYCFQHVFSAKNWVFNNLLFTFADVSTLRILSLKLRIDCSGLSESERVTSLLSLCDLVRDEPRRTGTGLKYANNSPSRWNSTTHISDENLKQLELREVKGHILALSLLNHLIFIICGFLLGKSPGLTPFFFNGKCMVWWYCAHFKGLQEGLKRWEEALHDLECLFIEDAVKNIENLKTEVGTTKQ